MKDNREIIHPIHGVWPLIGLLGILTARYYFSALPPSIMICPSRTLFGFRCPGCGSGEAVLALTELRIWDAFLANPLFIVGGFALSIWGATAAVGYLIGKPLPRWDTTLRRKDILRYTIITAFVLNWIYEAFIWPV